MARLPHLIALKLLARDDSRRLQDDIDLAALLAVASDDDIQQVGRAIDLIEAGGFQHHKKLTEELARSLSRFRDR